MVAYLETIRGVLNHKVPAGLNSHPMIASKEVLFTETAGAGVYTGSVVVPAGANIIDIQVRSTALWTAATSSTMQVGDVGNAAGWYTGINLAAIDLLVGEVIRFSSTGGKEGVYIVNLSGLLSAGYNAAAVTISGRITTVGGAGVAGRTRMLVLYAPAWYSAANATKV